MKTVITSEGKKLSSPFDQRFGREACFCIVDDKIGKTEFITNEAVNAAHGSGRQAAEMMVELGVGKVVSGDFGPKAKELLEKFNIQMVMINENDLTVGEIVNRLK